MKPALQAIVLADHVYHDAATGKFVICGTFTTVYFVKAPEGATSEQKVEMTPLPQAQPVGKIKYLSTKAGSPYAYFSLTDFQGKGRFDLRIVDLSSFEVLFGISFEVQCNDRLETIQQAIALPQCIPGDRPGTYVLELLHENEPIGSWRVRVIERKLEVQP